jgi:hypothetical protein
MECAAWRNHFGLQVRLSEPDGIRLTSGSESLTWGNDMFTSGSESLTYGNAMVNFPGRNGRRRRVLNDEVLSASSSHAVLRAVPKGVSGRAVPRYSEAAGVENHAQITDFIPRRFRSIALLTAAGILTTALLGSLHYFAATIAGVFGAGEIPAFDFTASGSIASWVASMVLLLASAGCLVVYSIRRYRIDDIRGRYRIWRAAAAACLFLSANSVASFHTVLAGAMSHLTGWTALSGDAVWWLTLLGLPATWIALRTLVEVRESRLAVSFLATSICSYAVAAATSLGAITFADARAGSTIAGATLLAGHWLALAAVVSYARFVVLDAQGLIAAQPRITGKRKTRKPASQSTTDDASSESGESPSTISAADFARRKQEVAHSAKLPASAGQWVDGSRPESDPYEDGNDESDDDRKLSKAERKRLRKIKMQNRAA